MKKSIFILTVSTLFFVSIISIISYDRVNSFDISRSLKLMSVDFSSNQINTMVDYVNRNREGYNQMREFKLKENIKPSISFNLPYNQNFNYDYQFQTIKTELPEYDYQKLYEVAYIATKNLNQVIDINYYPTEESKIINLITNYSI